MSRLEGRVAIVSGGGTGIGAATARAFAREGAKVVVTGRRPEPIEAVAAEVEGLAVAGDAADPDHATETVRLAVSRFGGLDVVVANAASGYGGAAGDVDEERWRRTIDVNLTGPLLLVRAALPAMLDRGAGAIVLVSSVSGLVSGPESAAYVTSKAGLLGLTRSLSVDYGPNGIRANAICPGWVVTPMGDRAMDGLAKQRGISREEAYRLVSANAPLRRPATAEEIAACCVFLASDESSIVTGTALIADGGGMAVDVADLAFGEPSSP
ncbi:MAG TPA: glucose 1-dehydrogenase [Actinomycetota bacterium]|jgi:NAD(P)-dependent dehydrogenase (short-subunit alcohol dehydrogenase family)